MIEILNNLVTFKCLTKFDLTIIVQNINDVKICPKREILN